MYWKVRKLTLKDMLMQNLSRLLLVFSVFINVLLIASHPSPSKGMTNELAANYKTFAKQVTQHLLDTSYLSYKQSTTDLLTGELDQRVIEGMKPLIREWMDEHFPALLDGAVRAEVERVVKARGAKR